MNKTGSFLLTIVVMLALTGALVAGPTSEAPVTPVAEVAAQGVSMESAESVEAEAPRIPVLGLASDDWRVEATEGCQYTCPGGNSMFCPDHPEYPIVECINNCCVYC